jgi:hypothetical protein
VLLSRHDPLKCINIELVFKKNIFFSFLLKMCMGRKAAEINTSSHHRFHSVHGKKKIVPRIHLLENFRFYIETSTVVAEEEVWWHTLKKDCKTYIRLCNKQ